MPRWDYDTVFYRVFCFTLLGIACTFTVILTNVFIDIDGLLYKKNEGFCTRMVTAIRKVSNTQINDLDKFNGINNLNFESDILAELEAKHFVSKYTVCHPGSSEAIPNIIKNKTTIDLQHSTANTDLERVQAEGYEVITTNLIPENIEKDVDYKDYGDTYDIVERTKRSLETQDYSFQIKDPKIKKVITDRLAALLADLDRKENIKTHQKENVEVKDTFIDKNSRKNHERSEKYKGVFVKNPQNFNTNSFKAKDIEWLDRNKNSRENSDIDILDDIERLKKEKDNKQKLNQTEEELKHLAMHNIILQGIIGHMDLGDVYTKVHVLMNNLENTELIKDNLNIILRPDHDKQFFNELTNCKLLKEQIHSETTKREMLTTPQTMERENRKAMAKPIGRNVMIKTIIDISSIANDKTYQDDASSKENVNGIIKLIYNGKSVNFRRFEESITTIKPMVLKRAYQKLFADFRMDGNVGNIKEAEDKILNTDERDPTYVPNLYMNKIISEYLKKYSQESESLENMKKVTKKRLKRHIKIRYENDETANITTEKPKLKGDDELYVEIETHFDSKGLKGEKKKKMIRELIAKIKKAIHSENEHKKKIHKHLHVKKRTQSPIDYENAILEHKLLVPIENLIHRELDPISRYEPYVSDDKSDDLRDNYYGPKYLSLSKAINSAEVSEIDIDYNRVMENGIPQRLQQPINSESDTKTLKYNHDPLNSKFILKNIGGSGFAVGFNQYTDEPPDAESINLFSGIENILKTYHQKYDEDTDAVDAENTYPERFFAQTFLTNDNLTNQEYSGPEPDQHTLVRRSTQKLKQDYHSNEYKVIHNKNFLNYGNYKDVLNVKSQWSIEKNGKQSSKRKRPAPVLRDNIFNRDLKPSEIFSLANLLDRNKRSIYVEKISNIKNKKKLSRYINTKPMASKKLFQQNRRSKRQINKIRIIAKDLSNHQSRNSNEDIFVLSDEKIFADRAVVKEVQTPYMEPIENINDEHYDVITPHKTDKQYYDEQKYSEDHYDVISPQKEVDNHYDLISPYILEPPPIEAGNTNNYFARRSRHNQLMSKYPHVFMEEISRSKEEDFLPESPILYDKKLDKYPVKTDVTTQSGLAIVEIPEQQNPVLQEIVNQFPLQNKGNYKVTVKIMPKNNTDPNTGFKEIHTTFNKTYNKNGLVYTSLVNVSEISKIEAINTTKQYNGVRYPNAKKIKIEHLKMKSLIQQHKDRIKEQLAHLNKEKQKLDIIDNRHTELLRNDNKDYIDIALPNYPGKTLHLTNEDLSRLYNLQETTIKVERTTTTTTTLPTTKLHVEPETENPDKLKIFNTIERNEHMTNEILRKIDKNTDILQIFLNKIINKLEPQIPVTTLKPEVYKNSEPKIYYDEQPTPKPQVLRADQLYGIPNIVFNQMPDRNGTRGIPFVYAFQHPYTMPNSDNKDAPIASIVYQGHIHANTVNNKPEKAKTRNLLSEKEVIDDKEKYKDTIPAVKNNKFEVKNDTKFFIDDLENEFKVMPVSKGVVYSANLVNGTKS